MSTATLATTASAKTDRKRFLARLFSKKIQGIVIALSSSASSSSWSWSSKNFNIGHNFCIIEDSNLIFGMHVYLMELHILSGESERSRSSFKVKGQTFFLLFIFSVFHVYLIDLHIWSGEKVKVNDDLQGQRSKKQNPSTHS